MEKKQTSKEWLSDQRKSYGYTCGNLARNLERFSSYADGKWKSIAGETPLTAKEKAIAAAYGGRQESGQRVGGNVYMIGYLNPGSRPPGKPEIIYGAAD